jgi:hypothetical protein
MEIYVLNYSINTADHFYSEYLYFSSMEKALEGKRILIEKDSINGTLACSSKDGQYLMMIYTAHIDSIDSLVPINHERYYLNGWDNNA